MNVRTDGIRALVSDLGVPGASLYVVAPTLELDHGIAHGVSDVSSLETLSVDSPLRVASNTKTFVALAFARLSTREEIDLDESIAESLPGPLRNALEPVYDVRSISLRHLLTHSSGLRCHTDDPRFLQSILSNPHKLWTREEQVRRAVELGEPLHPPGREAYYSDTGYVILGGILEKLSGQSLGAALRSLVDYGRLGLHDTWFERQETPTSSTPRARQYSGDLDATDWDPSMDLFGGGGLVSTVRDLAHFFVSLGEMPELSVLRSTPVDRASTELRAGVFERVLSGRTVFGHAGYWGTVAQVVPERSLAVAAAVTQRDAAKRLQELVDAVTEELI
ncbi:MAG: serine hydrolase domain-containing protein [Myxococcota bacterium]